MLLIILSSKKTRNAETGLPAIIIFVDNAVGPGLAQNTLCCCARPAAVTAETHTQGVPSFPLPASAGVGAAATDSVSNH